MNLSYSTVPTASRFQKDSSVTFAIRHDDIILKHIDWLLACYETHTRVCNASKRRVILCDLFLTCNFWIKSYHRNPRMKKERYPVVLALFQAVVSQLGLLLQCGRYQVSQTLDEIYGRELHTHGIQVDDVQRRAKYLSKLERQDFRLRFKGGLVYQRQWWLDNVQMPKNLVLAESSRAYSQIIRRAAEGGRAQGSQDYGGFIMTMERELYMAKHWVGAEGSQAGLFHSSYTAGDRVIMAGTMLIQAGVIRGIRADSGHYQPTEMNMAALIQAMSMYGVNLRQIELLDFRGDSIGNALDFLKAHVGWEQYQQQQQKERAHRVETDALRQARGGDGAVRFPHLQPQTAQNTSLYN